jgi:hypothetical protein
MTVTVDFIRCLRNRRVVVDGELGYFGLGGWWLSTFTRAEQKHIEASCQPSGSPANAKPLTTGRGQSNFRTAASLLAALAARLRNTPQERDLASRVLAKAEERAQTECDIIGLHCVYQEMIRLHNKWRGHFVDALNLTFGACHRQIAIAPLVVQALRELRPDRPLPGHLGFRQMALLLEQEGSYTKAIETCKQARDQGWAGNWTWRIGCLNKRRDEQSSGVTYISRSRVTPI